MTLPPIEGILGAAILIAAVISIPTKVRAAGDSAVAMVPLAIIWITLPSLHGTAIMIAVEIATLLLLLRAVYRHDRRLPFVLAALALVATVADMLNRLSSNPGVPSAYEVIALAAWIVSVAALWLNLVRNHFAKSVVQSENPTRSV